MAKINCSKHGPEGVYLVSPDIMLSITSQNNLNYLKVFKIKIESVFEDTVCWITKQFSSNYGSINFDETITLDVLEEIENSDRDFYSELRPVCAVCLREFLDKYKLYP